MSSVNNHLTHGVRRRLMKLRRQVYALRGFLPGLRKRHQLELMVGPLGYWDELQRYQLNALQNNGLEPGHTLLDVGCGPLQGGVAFIKYLHASKYMGLDHDPRRLRAAYSQIVCHDLVAKNPRLILSSDFGQRELNGEFFDFIWASQILYYFDESMMTKLLALVAGRLKPKGKFLGDIIGPEHYEFKFPECGWVKQSEESIQRTADHHGLQVRSLGKIAQYGYPKKLSLHSNRLLEITRKE